MKQSTTVTTPEDDAALSCAALPKKQDEQRGVVLSLDAGGKALSKPLLVSVGSADGTI